MQVLTGGCQPRTPQYGGGGGRMGSEMGPHITIGLSVTVFAVLRMFQSPDRQTDRQMGGRIGLAIGGTPAPHYYMH